MRSRAVVCALFLSLAGFSMLRADGAPVAPAPAVDIRDTRLLSEPAISAERIAFIYAGDLWVCGRDGGNVRRLTSDVGAESSPAFSPDGQSIAFSAQYEGNTDVYLVSAEGGVPRRLTWHPAADIVQGFTADGSAVLFTSPRAVHTLRYRQLFTVPVAGGNDTPLPIPNADRASYSPDGRRIAYNPLGAAYPQWKRYRGGRVSRVWIYDVATHAIEKVPQPAGRSNDAAPMWLGDTVYFLSDRDGEFNLYSWDSRSKAVTRLTTHADFPVLNASAGAGAVVYEQAGYVHVFDPKTRASTRVAIGAASDLQETRPRFVKGAKYVRSTSLSPSGARLAVEFRGEILSVPADKGDVRNLTNTPGAHERSPVWSPDARRIAYFSDESGEYELCVRSQDGKGEVARFKLPGAGFYDRPVWSPDSRKIAFTDNSWSVFWIDLATRAVRKIGSEYLYGPLKTVWPAWSPDSRWIVYTLANRTYIQTVYAYSLEQDKAFAVTDGLSDVSEPVFDRSGKYLYLLASTNAGPARNWFSLENEDVRVTRSIYMAVLRKDLPSPLVKESDEEKLTPEAKREKEREKGKDDNRKGVAAEDEKPAAESPSLPADKPGEEKPRTPPPVERVTIDREGLEYRILDLPIPPAEISNLQAGPAGQIFYLREVDGKKALQRFDLKNRKTETLLAEADGYEISADGKKILYRVKEAWAIAASSVKKIDVSEGKVKMDALEARIDPRAEWPQIFQEAWRINRDYFYDPKMHGVDWKAMREKYAAFLPHVVVRDDLNRVIQWMCSELSVGHHRGGGGDHFAEPTAVPGGLLGADYSVENGRYRFKKVYGGLNWNPELRSPLTEPGVNVRAGEYLLAVGGRNVAPPANLYSFFENTSGKLTEITVGPAPDGSGARTVTVVPVATEAALRNRDWVEGNIRKVDAATAGRVAYIYVPNTGSLGHTYFKRYFFPQAYKDAVILDERYNGGGSVADYYVDLLQKPLIAYWAMRYGADMKTPSASIQGPKAMIIDENAGSGGDLLPWMWRKFGVGTLIGQPTWGGLVGVLGFPVLMDGGTITAPNLAIWDAEKGWIVENEGVAPDIAVEQTPADVIAGRDPQLEKAISVVLDELKKHPAAAPVRPPYPNKTRAGV
ncbi:MAG: PDZ domain-containing protein [Acidobacteria bacterium]|nr:PDZ domain-containing protein [Acidobacteriota bacterium]MCA1612191.1 PDZ domain-containing protein [Acidobacteriota bacterium]